MNLISRIYPTNLVALVSLSPQLRVQCRNIAAGKADRLIYLPKYKTQDVTNNKIAASTSFAGDAARGGLKIGV